MTDYSALFSKDMLDYLLKEQKRNPLNTVQKFLEDQERSKETGCLYYDTAKKDWSMKLALQCKRCKKVDDARTDQCLSGTCGE